LQVQGQFVVASFSVYFCRFPVASLLRMERERLLNGEIDYEFEQVNDAGTAPTVTSSKPEVQVNLEGGDWLLTTLLITLDAILVNTKYHRFANFKCRVACHLPM